MTSARVAAGRQARAHMLRFRPLCRDDQDRLWHWLHIALWDPPPAGPRPLAILQSPGVRIYAEDWGRATDVGVVAVVDGRGVGACWMRLLPEGVGLAYVDEHTLQLGIALEPEFQRRGYGGRLLAAGLAAARSAAIGRCRSPCIPRTRPLRSMNAADFGRPGIAMATA